MKQTVRRMALVLFAVLFITASLAAQNRTPKRGRFTISVFGGALAGAAFIGGYTGNPIGLPNNFILPEYDPDSEGPLFNHAGGGMFGFSLGYLYGLTDPVNGRTIVSIYAEYSYCPAVKFKDATETLTRVDWSQAQFTFVDVVTNYPQTGRKAGMSGVTLGVICTPFVKIPLGLDLGFGLWSFKQEYVSGTLKAFQPTADISSVTGESSNTGFSYAGNGKLERNHGALTVKIGLTYRLAGFISLDATWRTVAYFDSHDTSLVYVESGKTVRSSEARGLADLFTAGITFGF